MSSPRDREPPGPTLTVRPDGEADFSSQPAAGPGPATAGDLRARVELFARLCQGIAFAHRRGVTHGRLALRHIRLAGDGSVSIEGWMDDGGEPADPACLAPEQVRGEAEAFAPASDLFSLGVILYQLISGRPPFAGETPLALTLAILVGEPPAPSSFEPAAPRALDELCRQLLTKEPRDRPASAEAVAEAAARAFTVEETTPERADPAPAGRPPALPTVARDCYRLGAEIARGGLGRIVEARDLRLDRAVAVKQLIAPEPEAAGRFVREALITARLQHPAIVPVHEAGRWPSGEPFYAMKRIAGRSLDVVIKEAVTLKERLGLLPHLIAVADAVAYAHSRRVIHRDLKPANILVGDFGETVVIDWGLAKDLERSDADGEGAMTGSLAEGLSVAGAVLGTPAYMPPEQAHAEPVDERADVYALGAILYHLLAGEPPYRPSARVLVELLAEPPSPLAARQKGVPRDLIAIVVKAMARVPGERYPSAREVADDLKKFQTGQLVGAHIYSPLERLRRFAHRHRAVLALGGAALAALAALGLIDRRQILVREREAVARADALVIAQARDQLAGDTTLSLALLKTLSPEFRGWGQARIIAADARTRGISRVYHGEPGIEPGIYWMNLSGDGRRLVFSHGHQVTVVDLSTFAARDLVGHEADTLGVDLSPDGTMAVSAAMDNTVRLWDLASGRSRAVGARVTNLLRFSPDGRTVATSGRQLHLIDARSGVDRPIDVDSDVSWADYAPDGQTLATAHDDHSVRLWDASGRLRHVLRGHRDAVWPGAFTGDGRLFVTPSWDGTARVWDVASGAQLRVLRLDNWITGVAISPDDKLVATAARDRTVRLWELATGDLVKTFNGPAAFTYVAFSPDGRQVAAGCADHGVYVWDRASDSLQVLRGHTNVVGAQVLFTPDGRFLISHGADATIRVWDMKTEPSRVLLGHRGAVSRVAFASDGKSLASGGADGTVRTWDLASGEGRIVERAAAPIGQLAWGRAGLAYASGDVAVELGGERRLLRHRGEVTALAYSPDGERLATGARDGSVHVLELATGEERLLSAHLSGDVRLAFSTDGHTLATRGAEGTICVWDDARPPCRQLAQACTSSLQPVFSADGRRLVTACIPERIDAWDVRTGGALGRVLPEAYNGFKEIVLSPDRGSAAIIVAYGLDVVIADMTRPGARRRLTGRREEFEHAVFSPDSRSLAAACFDASLALWDVASGEGRVLVGHRGRVLDVAFSPDGTLVASASQDGTIRLWPDDLPRSEAGLRAWLAAATPETVDPAAAFTNQATR